MCPEGKEKTKRRNAQRVRRNKRLIGIYEESDEGGNLREIWPTVVEDRRTIRIAHQKTFAIEKRREKIQYDS